MRRYAAMVFSECYSVTKSRHDAEDAAQATFLTLAIQARTGDEIRHLGPWLQRVGRRLALDQEKAKRRRKKREDNHHIVNGTSGLATPHRASMDQLELRHLINEELQQLPAKYRMPLILHYFGGLSRDQMAAELKCKPATLGVRLFRARDMLGKRLAKKGIALPAIAIPLAIAMVVRESVEQHGVLAMAATATQIADAASRVASGLSPHVGGVSATALAMADAAAHQIVLRRVKALVAAAAIGASALAAGGAQLVHTLQNGNFSLKSLFDFSGLFRSVSTPGLPEIRVDASQRLDHTALALNSLRFSGDNYFQPSTSFQQNAASPTGYDPRPSPFTTVNPSMIGGQSPVAIQPTVAMTPRATSSTPAAAPRTILPAAVARTETASAAPAPTIIAPSSAPTHASGFTDAPRNSLPFPVGVPDSYASASASHSNAGFFVASGTSSPALNPAPSLRPVTTSTTASNNPPTQGAPAPGTNSPSYDSMTGTVGSRPVVAGPQTTVISDAQDVLRGYGKLNYGGHFDMSGVVVADGYNTPRTLDLSTLNSAYNSIPNPPTGINGWYAQHYGKLTLPALTISANNSSTTFGDSATDTANRLDLVNSARMTFHRVSVAADSAAANGSAQVAVSLLAPDRPEIPAIPDGLTAITVWSLTPDESLSYTSLDFTARYALPGSDLSAPLAGLALYYFDDDAWHRLTSTIDPATRHITANNIPAADLIALLAVGSRTDSSLSALGIPTIAPLHSADGMIPAFCADGLGDLAGSEISALAGRGGGVNGITLARPGITSNIVPEPSALALAAPALLLLSRRRRTH